MGFVERMGQDRFAQEQFHVLACQELFKPVEWRPTRKGVQNHGLDHESGAQRHVGRNPLVNKFHQTEATAIRGGDRQVPVVEKVRSGKRLATDGRRINDFHLCSPS